MPKVCPRCEAPLPNFNICERCLTSFGKLVLPTAREDLVKARACLERRTKSALRLFCLTACILIVTVLAASYNMHTQGISWGDLLVFSIQLMGGAIIGRALLIFFGAFFLFLQGMLAYGLYDDWQAMQRISAKLKDAYPR